MTENDEGQSADVATEDAVPVDIRAKSVIIDGRAEGLPEACA